MTIRIDMIRQNTSHPDKCCRHQGRASCVVAGQHFAAEGPAPIYRLTTLLWLHGHGGAAFEVYDDVRPTGRPGGLAMRGKVRILGAHGEGQACIRQGCTARGGFLVP